jgi:hypothetical protein
VVQIEMRDRQLVPESIDDCRVKDTIMNELAMPLWRLKEQLANVRAHSKRSTGVVSD